MLSDEPSLRVCPKGSNYPCLRCHLLSYTFLAFRSEMGPYSSPFRPTGCLSASKKMCALPAMRFKPPAHAIHCAYVAIHTFSTKLSLSVVSAQRRPTSSGDACTVQNLCRAQYGDHPDRMPTRGRLSRVPRFGHTLPFLAPARLNAGHTRGVVCQPAVVQLTILLRTSLLRKVISRDVKSKR